MKKLNKGESFLESVMRGPVCGDLRETGFGVLGVRCSGSPDLDVSLRTINRDLIRLPFARDLKRQPEVWQIRAND